MAAGFKLFLQLHFGKDRAAPIEEPGILKEGPALAKRPEPVVRGWNWLDRI